MVRIATKFHTLGKEFNIITPYDAQRNALENALKSSAVPWEDKCFNVDSFQGEYLMIPKWFDGTWVYASLCFIQGTKKTTSSFRSFVPRKLGSSVTLEDPMSCCLAARKA